MTDESQTGQDGKPVLKVSQSGYDLLLNALLNKGMAFTAGEREQFNLRGLLPPGEVSLEIQRQRCYKTLHTKPSPIEKYIYLRDLQDSNETLFYSFLCEHLEELLPQIRFHIVRGRHIIQAFCHYLTSHGQCHGQGHFTNLPQRGKQASTGFTADW